jgi:hypothetical protein
MYKQSIGMEMREKEVDTKENRRGRNATVQRRNRG